MNKQLKTPVALIFFTRPDTFEKVFEQVRKAKPEKLFLIQDGAREGRPDDVKKIEECRKIAENIDWECEVYKNYSEVNLGCGKRPATGISWVFEHVDRVIILEDDCVPCDTFFPYCEEMLEKYKDDERISYISGVNHFEEWDCGKYSYFFAKTGAIASWATWKRSWDRFDYYVDGLNDEYVKRIIPYQTTNPIVSEQKVATWIKAYETLKTNEKLSHWDIQWGFVKYSQNQLVVVPQYNQVTNIGGGSASTHAYGGDYTKFIKYKNFVFIPTKDLEMPMVHQNTCICDVEYDNLVYKCMIGNKCIYKLKRIVKKILKRI